MRKKKCRECRRRRRTRQPLNTVRHQPAGHGRRFYAWTQDCAVAGPGDGGRAQRWAPSWRGVARLRRRQACQRDAPGLRFVSPLRGAERRHHEDGEARRRVPVSSVQNLARKNITRIQNQRRPSSLAPVLRAQDVCGHGAQQAAGPTTASCRRSTTACARDARASDATHFADVLKAWGRVHGEAGRESAQDSARKRSRITENSPSSCDQFSCNLLYGFPVKNRNYSFDPRRKSDRNPLIIMEHTRSSSGCALLRFATPATSTSSSRASSATRRASGAPDRVSRLPPGARRLRAAADGASMLRIKSPQGVMRGAQLEAVARSSTRIARVLPHHDAPEHPGALREAGADARGAAPPRRGRPDDARGVRQHRAQRDLLRARRRLRGRAFDVTPYGRPSRATSCATRSARRSRASSIFSRSPAATTTARLARFTTSVSSRSCASARAASWSAASACASPAASRPAPRTPTRSTTFCPADRCSASRGRGARLRSHRQPREQGARPPQVRRPQIGYDAFRVEFERELLAIVADGRGRNVISGDRSTSSRRRRCGRAPRSRPRARRFRRVAPHQRGGAAAAGYHAVFVRLVRGDITGEQLRAVARIARRHAGDGSAPRPIRTCCSASCPRSSCRAARCASTLASAARARARSATSPRAPAPTPATWRSRSHASWPLPSATSIRPTSRRWSPRRATSTSRFSGRPNCCGRAPHRRPGLPRHDAPRRRPRRPRVPAAPGRRHRAAPAPPSAAGRQGAGASRLRRRVRLLELYRRERHEGEGRAYFQRVDAGRQGQPSPTCRRWTRPPPSPTSTSTWARRSTFKVAIGQGECAS